MHSTGIEPANLRSLARRSNQLSYAAAVCYISVFLPQGSEKCIALIELQRNNLKTHANSCS